MHRELTPGEAAAVCYADVFEFPLTLEEVNKFQIANLQLRNKKFNSLNYFTNNHNHFFLKGRERIVQLRKLREKWSRKKLKIARRVANVLRFIPAVQIVAVTGALAMENCDENDDIDLLIVSKRRTVWTTRFFSIILLEFLGKRRRPKDSSASNKVCLNMFIDEDHLEVPKKEQDIFSAHEVAQVKILWGREEVEKRFREENEWIKRYLPNFKDQGSRIKESKKIDGHIPWILNFDPLTIGEYIFKQIQLWYMKNKRTTEIVKEGYLRFHPKDARIWIIPEYKKRLAIVGLK